MILSGVALLAALAVAAAASPPSTPAPSAPGAASAILTGTVRTAENEPVAGALVVAWPATGQPGEARVLQRFSERDGRFRIPLVSPGPHHLRVEAPGFAWLARTGVAATVPLSLTLERGGNLEGQVRDARTGAPVPGARVDAFDGGPQPPPAWGPKLGLLRTTADARGQFRFEGVGRGLWTIAASGRGYRRAERSGLVAGGRTELLLFPGAGILGTIVGPNRKPQAAAVVWVENQRGLAVTARPELTDAAGRVEVLGLIPGSYRLVVRHPDLAPAVVTGLQLTQGEERVVRVSLESAAWARGRLISAAGRPVRGRVHLQDLDGQPLGRVLGTNLRAESGPDGTFELLGLPRGTHQLLALAPGFGRQRVVVHIRPGQPGADLGTIRLEPGPAIFGTVREPAGSPVAGALVRALALEGETGGLRAAAEEETAADGTFALAGIAAGRHLLRVAAAGYGPVEREVPAGAAPVAIVLQPAGAIAGRVVGEGGRPIEAFEVRVRGARRQAGPPLNPSVSASMGSADGGFRLDDLGAGVYLVEVSSPGWMTRTLPRIEVSPARTTDLGAITLSAGGRVRGMVVDADGEPVAGATIAAQGPSGRASLGWGPRAVSDPAGAFELAGVPAGPAELLATHPEYAEKRLRGLVVDPAQGALEVTVVMTTGGRVEGRVLRRDGTGIPGIAVQVVPLASATSIFFGALAGTATTDGDGSFAVDHVPAGPARVVASGRSEGVVVARSADLEIEAGTTSQVELVSKAVLVTGRIVREGVPVPALRVSLHSDSPPIPPLASLAEAGDLPEADMEAADRTTAVTGKDGSFALYVASPGKVYVELETLDGTRRYPARSAEIPDQPLHLLELELPGARVRGTVADGDTGQGLPRASVTATARRPAGVGAGSTTTDAEGRFELELEEGDYEVEALLSGYTPHRSEVAVEGSGGIELAIELSREHAITGTVVDGGGRGAGGLPVFATGEGDAQAFNSSAVTAADGTFRLGSLPPGSYTLLAGTAAAGFALRSGVSAGEILLTLEPPGRLRLGVQGPGGVPIAGATVSLSSVNGARIPPALATATTDEHGLAELGCPAGRVEVTVRHADLIERVSLALLSGASVAIAVELGAPSSAPPPPPAGPLEPSSEAAPSSTSR